MPLVCRCKLVSQRQKRESDPLALEIQAIVSDLMQVVRTELRSSVKNTLTTEPLSCLYLVNFKINFYLYALFYGVFHHNLFQFFDHNFQFLYPFSNVFLLSVKSKISSFQRVFNIAVCLYIWPFICLNILNGCFMFLALLSTSTG